MSLAAKKSQSSVGISFGMIFSILIIIFLVAMAIYGIKIFLDINKCAQTGLLFDRIQRDVDDAWRSGIVNQEVVIDFPASGIRSTGLTHICFGLVDPSTVPTGLSSQTASIYQELADIFGTEAREYNLFVYPPDKACDRALALTKIKHAAVEGGFFCKEIQNDKLVIHLEKDTLSSLVKIKI